MTQYHQLEKLRAAVQVYKVGKKGGDDHGAKTDFDPTEKDITPMGGFVGYGEVGEDYLLIKVGLSALPFQSLHWLLASAVRTSFVGSAVEAACIGWPVWPVRQTSS